MRARLLADEEEREAQRLAAEAAELLRGKVEAKAALLDQLDDLLARETLSMEARAPRPRPLTCRMMRDACETLEAASGVRDGMPFGVNKRITCSMHSHHIFFL